MPASLMPMPKQAFYGLVNGVMSPIVGGKVYTYEAGTTTPKATYTTAAGDVANANPVILDSRGEASVWLGAGSYKIVLKDAADVTIWTQDGVESDRLFVSPASGGVPRLITDKLSDQVSVTDFGAVGDGVTDNTAAVLNALTAAIGKRLLFPAGTYVWDSVVVPGSVDIVCDPGVTFKRKAGADGASESYWNAGAAMLEVEKNGIAVSVSDFTYDGNSANQTTTEPTGWFIRIKPPAVVGSDPITVHVKRGVFTGGTSGYLLLRGDDVNRRYKTFAYVDDCRFYDTVYGKGKGDPSTPNSLGYNPTYVLVLDYVQVRTNNFHAEFNAATGTGQYAATAINGTFFGSVYANSGESSIFLHGTTYIKNLGRSAKKYNDNTDWVTNNGIGAIDCYGNADTLFVENLVAVDCQNVPVRAKGSLKTYIVQSATLKNCHRGLQVGPSTTGACETIAKIGSVRCDGGTIPQLEFVGNSADDGIPSVTIDSVFVSGSPTNPEGLVAQGAVRFRYVARVHGRGIGVYGAPLRGIEVVDVVRCELSGIIVNSTVDEGVYLSGGNLISMSRFDIRNTGGIGVSVANNPSDVFIDSGRTDSTKDYGVFCNTTTSNLFVNKVSINTVSGTGRGFYAAGGYASFTNCTSTGAATPLFVVAGTNKREDHNSWNAVVNYSSAAPVDGTWKVGDVVYNTSPAAGGTIGWVCTTAGTPGTWKTFGAIAT